MMSGRKTEKSESSLVKMEEAGERAMVSPRADAYHVAKLFFHFIKVNLLQICCVLLQRWMYMEG